MIYRQTLFGRLAKKTSLLIGHPYAFLVAIAIILLWLLTGPIFHFSDTWQLIINTGTTIITFLVVFLIQNSQNRDTAALQIKLDELIRVTADAHNALLDLEELPDRHLQKLRRQYEALAANARAELARGGKDFGSPELIVEENE